MDTAHILHWTKLGCDYYNGLSELVYNLLKRQQLIYWSKHYFTKTSTMAEGYHLVSNYSSSVIVDGISNASMDDLSDVTRHITPPPLLKQSMPMVVVFCLAYILVFILAVVNNSLVVSVICRNPQMRTVTNYFLANLAVADITVSFLLLPITLLSNLFNGKFF